MTIKDFLFGKKVVVSCGVLGDMDARIRNKNSKKEVTWAGAIQPHGVDEIVLLLDGNTSGPYESQIQQATWVVQNLQAVRSKIEEEISNNPQFSRKLKTDNIDEFSLAFIGTDHTREDSIELCYELGHYADEFFCAFLKDREVIALYP